MLRWRLTWALGLALPVAAGLALLTGSVATPPETLWTLLSGGDAGIPGTVITELRLPRVLAALGVGACLGLAGSLLQVLLRNPLADPYVLGVSGGAAVGALLALLGGMAAVAVSGSAFAGALASTALVFGLGRGAGAWSTTRLLLTGVILAAGWGALVSLILSLSPSSRLHSLLYWLMGDLSLAAGGRWTLLLVAVALAVAMPQARALNLLARGSQAAAVLGVNVNRLRGLCFVSASALTAVAVSVAGSIGFVGLIVPHLVRLLSGADHRTLLINAALAGGLFLLLADLVARTVLLPRELPVGAVTALLGVPLFLVLLRRSYRGGPTSS
ncbi:MAG: iron ABC transporter permease [Gammaproteobacteria bacterium]|nr:iron ABC transporter permease [Gammaproteobacteria bacterium]